MGHLSFERRFNGRLMRQPSLQEMGLVRPHDYKENGELCGAINPWPHHDEFGKLVLPIVCRCGESLVESSKDGK